LSDKSVIKNAVVSGGSAIEFEAKVSQVHAAKIFDEVGVTRTKAKKSTRMALRW
jgi:hypothetical protein